MTAPVRTPPLPLGPGFGRLAATTVALTTTWTLGACETEDPNASQTPQEASMQTSITVDGQRFTATLDDSAAACDLLTQLPVTVDMVDHGGVEQTGPLPKPLSLEGQPDGADPNVGDIGYYASRHDVVLYYGDQSYFSGIVVLGRLDGDAANRIAAIAGPVTATIEAG